LFDLLEDNRIDEQAALRATLSVKRASARSKI